MSGRNKGVERGLPLSRSSSQVGCPNFRRCGGCQLLAQSYPEQLAGKLTELRRVFAEWPAEVLEPKIVACPQPRHYRCKVQLPFGRAGRRVLLGCYAGESHEVVDQSDCLIQDEDLNAVAGAIRDWAGESGLHVYDEATGRGFLRYLLLRKGLATGEILLTLITTSERVPGSKRLSGEIREAAELALVARRSDAKLVGIVQNLNDSSGNVVLGQRSHVWWGQPWLTENLRELSFRIGPTTFFQVNPWQTPNLYDLARAAVPAGARVLDLYCGVGSLTMWLADRAALVVGVEENRASVVAAQAGARHNRVENVRFITADAGEFLHGGGATGFDSLVLDPPRKGLEPSALAALRSTRELSRLIYVSCNPETLARDLAALHPNFRLAKLTGVDMFPQTTHLECVAVLERG